MGLMYGPDGLFMNFVPTRGLGENCHFPLLLYINDPKCQEGGLTYALLTCPLVLHLHLSYLPLEFTSYLSLDTAWQSQISNTLK
jgi:hypothetical protein